MPPIGATNPEILRGESFVWWRSVLGVIMGLSFFLLLTTLVSQGLVTLFWAISGSGLGYRDYYAQAYAFQRPLGMLAVNLGLLTLIPIAMVMMMFVHHVRPRWLVSVRPRPRWVFLGICVGLAVVAVVGSLLLSTLVSKPFTISPQAGFWGFFVVILLTSPLQAAAEEVFFRGYLMQALGSLYRQPWVGVVASSVVFALFHGVQNPALFLDRLAFGLLAAILVLRTGGLEAGIAAHAVNNVCAYLLAGLTSTVATVKAIRGISWVDAAFDVGAFALFAVLAAVVAYRMRLQTRVGPTPVW